MNRQEAIKNFVKVNYELLTKKEGDKKEYKAALHTYFQNKLKYKYGIPRDKEICDALVEVIIKMRNISEKADLDAVISATPFLRMNNTRANDYTALIDMVSERYKVKDSLDGLKSIEKLDKMADFVKKEKTKEIRDLILQKQQEYKNLPSILDDNDFPEPAALPQKDETKEWWEELNLKENPFPGPLDGFFLLDKRLYDEIIVETPPIQWALKRIQKVGEPDIFHKGFLLGGEFGTGKTTFFDYLAPHLTVRHIEPIRIALSDNINVAHYVQKFEKEMCLAIAKIAKNYLIPRSSAIIDFEEARLLMLDLQGKGVKGFLIFIDDLHKNIDTNCVFNFLANLQITKNTLSRDGVNAVFIVAGFPGWRVKIRQDSALTGFFDAPDELTLPEVSPEIAAQAIKKRLQAFSANPEKEITIKEEFLRTVFRRVSSEIGRTNIGFRPYIQEAVNNFSAKKFDILGIDYTKLDEHTMKDIKQALEGNSQFKESIDRLIFGKKIQKKEVRELILKILCEIYLRRGAIEEDEIFQKNKFAFKRLTECNLIQKYDRGGRLVWKINPLFVELNKEIIGKFKLSLEDYLVPIYSTPTLRPKEVKPVENKTEVYRNDLEAWKSALEPELHSGLSKALIMYSENIYPYTQSDSKKAFTDAELEKIKECIWVLMKCIIRFESPLLLDVYGETEILGWTLRHRSLESSQHYISLARGFERGGVQKTDIARIISFANDSFIELWNEFKKSLNVYQSSSVKCHELPREMLKTIYSEHDQIISFIRPKEEYFDTIKKFVEVIEKIIRKYLLVSNLLIFGPYHIRMKYYPEDIKRYIKGGSHPAVSYEGYNEFENMNRGQYRGLFTQLNKTSEFYRFIIEPVIKNWDLRDINAFFQIFGDLNILTSHLKSQWVEERKKDIPTFFRLSCRLIASLAMRLRQLVIQDNAISKNTGKTEAVFGYIEGKEKGSRNHQINDLTNCPPAFFRHEITKFMQPQYIGKIMDNSDNILGDIEIDILDVDGIIIKFGMNYCDSMGLLAYLLKNIEIRAITLYGTNVCLRKHDKPHAMSSSIPLNCH